ncbi:MAG: DHH family phosphoesterase [Candidatus Aenigmarchaeota archaeon]|nr:DHH family phosphoesterase [Candidatus Aenigmarchaeota archaeon]
MKWDSEKKLEELGEMLEAGRVLLLYHHDTDGICSAALLLRFFPKMKSLPLEGPRLDRKEMKRIASQDADVMIFLDLPVDQEFESLMQLKRKAKLAVIDHHIAERDLSRWGVLHINPRLEKDVYLPTSYMVYKILEKLGKKPSGVKWISCIGVYGDYGMKDCAAFLASCDMGREGMALGSELISAAVTLKGLKGADIALKYLLASEDFSNFSRSNALKAWKAAVSKEFNEIMGHFDGGKELYPDAGLVIYEIRNRLNLTSAVSNRLSELLPDLVVMIRKKHDKGGQGKEWKLSLRCQSGRVNLGLITKKCAEGIGSGGGHKKAAGAVVSDYGKFLARLRAELKRA